MRSRAGPSNQVCFPESEKIANYQLRSTCSIKQHDLRMNPCDYVTDNIVESVERVIHSEIGGRMWDGNQHPVDFLHEIASPQLAGEYLAAVHEYMEARELLRWRAPAERLFRVSSQPLVQQFLHSWNINSRVDELAVFGGVVSSLNKLAISVGDLGCGPGQITNIIGRLHQRSGGWS